MKIKNRIFTFLVAFTFVFATFFMSKNVQAEIIKGIDVYEYDNISDYAQLKAGGTEVIIQKASQGLYHNDSLLQYRYDHALAEGFKIGFYHFADNSGQPIREAQHFLSQIKGLHSDTVLWLDIENQPDWTKVEAVNYTNQFIQYVQAQGYKIGVYTGLSFYYEYLQGNIPDVPMWLASYGRQPKQFPNVVSWQYTDQGQLNGVIGDVDLDYFNDSIFTGIKPNSQPIVQATQPQRDSKVVALQTNLKHLLQWNISIDGIPGPQTATATKQLQEMTNINVDGIAGNQTNSVINQVMAKPSLRYGSDGTVVKYLQYRLGITNDGKFRGQTRQAVINFQNAHGLVPDGIVGSETWRVLLDL